jgi:hypothetical protein
MTLAHIAVTTFFIAALTFVIGTIIHTLKGY